MVEVNSVKKCPACGAKDAKNFLSAPDPDNLFTSSFILLRCRSCDLVFLGETVKSDSLYSRNYYRAPKLIMNPFFDMGLYFFILDRFKLIKRYKAGTGKILDIGCGDGSFLSFMKKRGWQAFGIDSSASTCDYMNAKNLVLIGQDFLESPIDKESMDVVTYWYSFEHLSNPVEYLQKTYRVLKNDGILIVSVPNISSMQAVFSRKHWFHLDLPRHTLHFSPATLREALLKSGFEILAIEHRSLQMNIMGWYQSLLNLSGCQPNFLYNLFKRGCLNSKKMIPSLLITLFASPFILPASLILSRIEEFCGRGGIINAIAKKHI